MTFTIIDSLLNISMLAILYDYVIVFYEFLASHITRPPSKYDVRLNNTA